MKPNNFKVDQDKKIMLDTVKKKYTNYLIKIFCGSIILIAYYYVFFKQYGPDMNKAFHGLKDFFTFITYMFYWKDFFHWPFKYYIGQVLITIAIVITATTMGSLVAILLSFLAARTLNKSIWMKPLNLFIRRLFDIFRAVDIAVWGLIFVRAVGMGPFAGVLAIFIADVGFLGRLFADHHDSLDKKPSKGLDGLGASSIQKNRFAIFTQSFPQFLSFSLYEIESNIRSAAVLGFVGAGGVGLVYSESMRLWNWGVVGFITILLVLVVMLMDKVSSFLRNKYITGNDIPLYKSNI
ncbi:phosphonate ABC transporter, permease protein PhnE [Paraphotobacterium marinum]|uniref:Phosphonate ABC transporter, permease protein PhnE n=1 Tax=Paraphotobacterium marinum TaxID=1755811 RepID=A0A220VEK5_9GAMM|nr:phosphonate ABC transporter, permease protein PhnE [Paraphotobacterium marinum]ASK78721.1 phosphonate ABC transporter, permease protein PhnE [Paraphotobacterium marinum]